MEQAAARQRALEERLTGAQAQREQAQRDAQDRERRLGEAAERAREQVARVEAELAKVAAAHETKCGMGPIVFFRVGTERRSGACVTCVQPHPQSQPGGLPLPLPLLQ